MCSDFQLTMKQALAEVEQYKQVFTSVFMLDEGSVSSGESAQIRREMQTDHRFTDKLIDTVIEVCRAALAGKAVLSKLVFSDTEIYQITARYITADGKPYIIGMVKSIDLSDSLVLDGENHSGFAGKLASYHENMYKDILTNVYNRRYYEEQLKSNRMSAGVAVIDLDGFDLYNSTYGHDTGDLVLAAVAETIEDCISPDDTLIRYGGDEFLLIIPDANDEAFTGILENIRERVKTANVPNYSWIHITASIGGLISDGEALGNSVLAAENLILRAKNRKDIVLTDKSNESSLLEGKPEVLIVDDSEMNRELLAEMLGSEYKITEAENGEECMAALKQRGTGISLILLDIVMPVANGFDVLDYMTSTHRIEDIPVIMISSENSEATVRKAYELGVTDYISRPFDARVVCQRVANTIKLYSKQKNLTKLVTEQVNEKEKNNRMMIRILSQIVEFRNGESGSHVLHIEKLTEMLMKQLLRKTDRYKIDPQMQELIPTASALHDIGKIGIEEKILNKPGKLTPEEFEIMKKHSVIGESILTSTAANMNEPLIKVASQICRWHHERYDGRGYPDGLKGDEIPISAQIVSLADVYDALTSERVYKKAFSHEKTMEMIQAGQCGVFNPILIECLVDIQEDVKRELLSDKAGEPQPVGLGLCLNSKEKINGYQGMLCRDERRF